MAVTCRTAASQATYVTGSQELKAGVMLGHAVSPSPTWWSGDITMTFNNGSPQSVTMRIPSDTRNGYFPDLGIYAQDRWSFKRATMTGGIRYDYYVGNVLDGTLPASRWNPAQFFPGFSVQKWKDFSPRFGIAYDLFGNREDRGQVEHRALRRRPTASSTAAANNPADHRRPDRHAHLERSERRLHDLQRRRIAAVERARPDDQLELRQGDSLDQHAGSGDVERLRGPRLDHRVAGGRPTRAVPARRADRRLLLPVQRQSAGHGQHARHERRLRRSVLHHRAVESGSAGRRRLPGVRAVRHQAGIALAAAEQRHVRAQLRRDRRSLHGLRHHACRRGLPTARSFRAGSMRSAACLRHLQRADRCRARRPRIRSTTPRRSSVIRCCRTGPTSRCWRLTTCRSGSRSAAPIRSAQAR